MSLRILGVAMVLACLALSPSSVKAQTVIGLSFIESGNTIDGSTQGTDITLTTTASGDLQLNTITDPFGEAPTAVVGAVTLTDGGFSGLYNISLDVESTGSVASGVGRGGSGTLSPGGNLFLADEELTFDNVVLTKVSGDDFVFDGFNGVIFGNANANSGENGTANGTTFTIGAASVPGINTSGRGIAPAGSFDLASSAIVSGGIIDGSDGVSLNLLTAQFSAVNAANIPEPSSLAVLGLGSLTLLRRRRN